MVQIAPSILSADFAELAKAVEAVTPEIDMLHVDVMDGHFVPNLTIGPPVVASLRRHTDLPLDCHLMITDPADYLEAFAKAGADGCTVHVELGDPTDLIRQCRDLGIKAGIAVNPDTPFEQYRDHLAAVDMVLLMTVFPGFGGQSFIADVLPKIAETRRFIDEAGLATTIQVDGGIDPITGPQAAEAGAEIFVAGSAIFGADSPPAAARRLREAVTGG